MIRTYPPKLFNIPQYNYPNAPSPTSQHNDIVHPSLRHK